MLNRTFLGTYYPMKSPIHFMNPVSKIMCTIIFIAMTLLCRDIRLMMLISFIVVFTIELAHIPNIVFLKTFSGLKILFLFLLVIYYFAGSKIITIIMMIIKLYDIVLYTTMITMTTPPNEITYGLQIVFMPLNIIKIPVNKMALSISLALRFIPTIIDQGNKIMKSQASRGIDYYASNLSGKFLAIKSMLLPMFILTIRRADNLAESMQIRLYDVNAKRTNFRKNAWSFFDTFLVIIHLAILILMIVKMVIK